MLKVAWARFSTPEIGPEVVFNAPLLNLRDRQFAAWNQRHPLHEVRLFKVLIVARAPIIQERANHYVWVGTVFGFGVSYWVVAALVLVAQIPWVTKVAQRRRRTSTGLCGHCGYNLTGNTSGVCPECGRQAKFLPDHP